MKKLNFPVITTVILNSFIVIGAGHGLGILLIYEILSPRFILADSNAFNWDHYDERLVPVAFLSLMFQLFLLMSLKIKRRQLQKILINVFCITLVFIFFILVKDFSKSNVDTLSLISGVPFLISSLFLLFKVNYK
ncbi:hypothetical protein [Chryseobacterium profundimaris]|uniref:Uncharacterized protein n=1 Tax=Chryseobacterium profundimaris TaxID=1387275 RepID=A0ABY1PKJ5_9FLAO|nr:hypothetical protein [Chryseobacterium profundimaris]SMP36306.1 hypothetical protein SAMN06264346_1276 [Chryseobacterium profundimaris]